MISILPLLLVACTHRGADTGERAPVTGLGLVVVSDSGSGRWIFEQDGQILADVSMADLLPEQCDDEVALCIPYGIQRPGALQDGTLLSFGRTEMTEDGRRGGVMWIRSSTGDLADLQVDWVVDQFSRGEGDCTDDSRACMFKQPHMARLFDDELWVTDTLNNRVLRIAPDGAGGGRVLTSLESSLPDWGDGLWPNSLQLVDVDARRLLVVSFKSSEAEDGSQGGLIRAWDVSTPDAPWLAWRYPAEGYLADPHGARVVEVDGDMLLLYAHSRGASAELGSGPALGSVGVARLELAGPTYLGDLVLDEGQGAFGFLRAVHLQPDGVLLVTDSACEAPQERCEAPAQLLEIPLLLPDERGLSGAFSPAHERQAFVSVAPLWVGLDGELSVPFDARPVP